MCLKCVSVEKVIVLLGRFSGAPMIDIEIEKKNLD